MEPSYYSWMMQGDFPLYTKRKLEEIYNRWNAKKIAERQPKPVTPKPQEPVTGEKRPIPAPIEKPVNSFSVETKPKEAPVKRDFHKPHIQQNNHHSGPQNKPYKKKDDEPALPVNEDMLKQLADKFKKGI